MRSSVGLIPPKAGKEQVRSRTVVDGEPLKKVTVVYGLDRKWCPRCRKSVQPRVPGVLPRSLYGNHLLTHVVMQHYVYGVPLGRLEAQLGIGYGSLMAPLHRLSRWLNPVMDKLIEEYRHAPVKHADETSPGLGQATPLQTRSRSTHPKP